MWRQSATFRSLHAITRKQCHFNSFERRALSSIVSDGSSDDYDVVIVGGGIAGTALACSIASNPALQRYRVALVEAMDLTHTRNWNPVAGTFSNRVVSLTPASMTFFDRVGVSSHFVSDRIQAFGDMQVWDGVSDARIQFNTATEAGSNSSAIAYIVENVHLQNAILKRLDACRAEGAQVDILEKARVQQITMDQDAVTAQDSLDLSDWPTVHLENDRLLKARLLVGADGVNSPVRSFANIESLGWDYDAQGVVATLKLDPTRENNTAWQRFLPTGPIAMLPLGNGYASLVWSTRPHLAKLIKGLSQSHFCELVNAAFRLAPTELKYFYSQIDTKTFKPLCNLGDEFAWREGVAIKSMNEGEILDRELRLPPMVIDVDKSSRASFPLRLRNSEHYVTDRVALVGDAAHTIHPLAGQGLNQGLLDVECLARMLAHGTMEGQDIGNIHLLRNYASERYPRNIVMLSACDKLHRLFSTDAAPITWIRSFGLSALNNVDFVKSEIMKFAMGIEKTDIHGQ